MDITKYILGGKRHPGYVKSVELYDELICHAEGAYPQEAIEARRPSEPDDKKDYRKKIFVPIAKTVITQIKNVVGKIRRSQDWMIEFPQPVTEIPASDGLEEYCRKKLPHYGDIEFWAFGEFIDAYLMGGAYVLVVPENMNKEPNEFYRPMPVIYSPKNVLEANGDIVILKDSGTSYKVIDKDNITTVTVNGGSVQIAEFLHGLPYLPVVKVPGRYYKKYDYFTVNESPIQSVAAYLKEFVREYSDLQAEVVQHIHSETWQWATLSCKMCEVNGISTGRRIDKKTGKTTNVPCDACHGTGAVASSPFTNIVVRPAKKNLDEQPAPIPPKGIIEKNTEIVKIQNERVERHLYKALESLNMHFLLKTPQNQSGYAKDVDAQETQNTVYAMAEDIVWTLDKVIKIICDYRYGGIMGEDERAAMLPNIPVPEKYDLLASVFLLDDIAKASQAKINPSVITAMQIEFIKKKFYYTPNERDRLVEMMRLDPLAGLTEDEKMVRFQNGGTSENAYVISCNISPFIMRAHEEHDTFSLLPYVKQYAILEGYAEELIKETKDISTLVPRETSGMNGMQ
jgi:hypothetical protein